MAKKKTEEKKPPVTLDDIEFQDAVIAIPANTIYIKHEVRTCENGEVVTLKATYSPKDIREMFDLFEKTAEGDYPKYQLTEKGRRELEEKLNGEC